MKSLRDLISDYLIQTVIKLPSLSCEMQVFRNRNIPEIRNSGKLESFVTAVACITWNSGTILTHSRSSGPGHNNPPCGYLLGPSIILHKTANRTEPSV